MRKDTYTKPLNPVDYKSQANSLASMTPEIRQAYLAGVFTAMARDGYNR